jgi:protein SCO1/2
MNSRPSVPNRFLAGARQFLSGTGLPVFLLSATLVYEAFLIAVVFAPPGSGPWSRFSEEFKVWCFGYDSGTGGMEWGEAWAMLLEPLFLASLAVILYRGNLRTLLRPGGIRGQWRAATGGTVVASMAIFGLVGYGKPEPEAARPFPGERIRTRIEAPEIRLTDHRGKAVDLDDLRGRVVLVTGVYAMCSTSCPEILREVKALTDSLPEAQREHLSVLALSLNPEYDTARLMSAVASGYGFSYPEFRYLNGDPEVLRELLTRLQFSPVRNEETGLIDHANLFLLIDADGRIAYRFNLDPRHRPWLEEATSQLIQEAAARNPGAAGPES